MQVGHYGGSVALADYCPYIQEFTWRSNNVVVRGSHCAYTENQPSECRNIISDVRPTKPLIKRNRKAFLISFIIPGTIISYVVMELN